MMTDKRLLEASTASDFSLSELVKASQMDRTKLEQCLSVLVKLGKLVFDEQSDVYSYN